MGKLIDITGQRFGRLVVLRREGTYVSPDGRKNPTWLCRCDCGNEIVVEGDSLRSGNTKSCGCLNRDVAAKQGKSNAIHGGSGTRLYNIWKKMKQRCYDPKNNRYHRYGGRGITVCDEWMSSFQAFYDWSVGNGYADNLSIDRIDVNGNYEPTNCRWASMQEQLNNRTDNHNITINGVTNTIAEWCRRYSLSPPTVWKRIRRGWSAEEAFGIVPRKKKI